METKTIFSKLLAGMKCSYCSCDFDENSIRIMRFDDGLHVIRVKCEDCGKSFGIAYLGLTEEELERSYQEVRKKNTKPITIDDVLDAHNYIKNLDENWKEFMKGNGG